ncbi:cilia- and flagella-associated protein 251-like isoform X2 [Physella acuta]|uniref:cilia- and flagella-associated protein 251-like isoform X2 n=1 Tax=Physella acuta TaxID=109671 RepID=UPI0027DC8925|nr:cilia- and flagella-associated protein 251-like isoform X2 [Physella acuta]
MADHEDQQVDDELKSHKEDPEEDINENNSAIGKDEEDQNNENNERTQDESENQVELDEKQTEDNEELYFEQTSYNDAENEEVNADDASEGKENAGMEYYQYDEEDALAGEDQENQEEKDVESPKEFFREQTEDGAVDDEKQDEKEDLNQDDSQNNFSNDEHSAQNNIEDSENLNEEEVYGYTEPIDDETADNERSDGNEGINQDGYEDNILNDEELVQDNEEDLTGQEDVAEQDAYSYYNDEEQNYNNNNVDGGENEEEKNYENELIENEEENDHLSTNIPAEEDINDNQANETGRTSEEPIKSPTTEVGTETNLPELNDGESNITVGQEIQFDAEKSSSTLYDKETSNTNKNASTADTLISQSPKTNLPTPARSYTSIEGQMSTSALNIVWSFGLNRNVPVLNLSDGVRHAIMYPCAHVGIMYDYKNNKQHILQAHLNPITCSAVSHDKRWLVTGDVGPDAMVNIWDTYTGTPIQTMFDPNPKGGVVAVALTPDSRYLATLSALPIQTLAIWDWTVDGDVPICSADLKPEYGLQNFICFDSTDCHHLVTNSETQVLFLHWEDNSIKYYAPPLSDEDFNKPVGRYSQSMFQIGIARALTATSIGNLVVWDNNRPLSKIMDVNQSADKKPLKIIKVHDKGINVLTNTDNYIVIGDTAGHIKFYDQGLRLIYWYQEFHSGSCTSISFAHMPDFVPVATEGSKYPSDATKQAKPFVIRDFIVGTAIAIYCSINTDGSKLKIIHREHDAAVHALAAHPKLPIVAIGSYSGLLKLWNYRTKEVVASKIFEKSHIQCCTFDPKGFNIAIGCTNGALFLVDSVALLDQLKEPFKYARDAITHIAFSHNSMFMATADAGFTITVYKRQRKEMRSPYIWHGRYRSHYKPIKDLLFEIHLDTNMPKLLSLGEDRMLIEYDLFHHGKTNKVVPCAFDRIEQAAIPQCMTKYPPITKEQFFLTANDQYKFKCYNSTTKMCRKVVLGPTYGSPIRKMMVVPTDKDETKNRFLAYITDDKIGLHFLPATGNPHLAMALIAHPSGVSNLTCSFDGAYLFTAGGPDFAVHMWEINIAALSAQAKLGGEDLVPFYGLLEGGRDGELFAELEDLFYYAQLRHQGINCLDTRQISNRVPLTEVPYIMRAMGFYPSEQEIEDMLNEIKYDEYVNLGHYQEDIDLGGFIKLYVNHRPAFGLSAEKLLWAFETLAESVELGKGGMIERGDFLQMLERKGEHMTEEELTDHLTTLLGFNKEGGSAEEDHVETSEEYGHFIHDALPFDINAEILINEILGFSMTVDPPAKVGTKDVVKSGAS